MPTTIPTFRNSPSLRHSSRFKSPRSRRYGQPCPYGRSHLIGASISKHVPAVTIVTVNACLLLTEQADPYLRLLCSFEIFKPSLI